MSHDANPHPDVPNPAPRSGGPKTPEGKERSRRNALKHGLRARVLTPDEMIDDVIIRTADFARQFRPQNTYQEWLVGEIALATVRIDRCAALSIVDLQRRTNNSEACWDLDRRRDVADLGANLKRDPARVLRALEATRHGADWLIERWEGLALTLDKLGDWDEAQHRLALDMLGIPPELRRIQDRLPEGLELKSFVQRQLHRLRALKESCLDAQDEDQRTQTGLGLASTTDPMTANLQRYERSCRRALHWARAELARHQAEPEPSPEPAPPPRPLPSPDPVIPPRDATSSYWATLPPKAMARTVRNVERLLKQKLPPQTCAELGIPMIPPRSATSPTAPPDSPRAGTRA